MGGMTADDILEVYERLKGKYDVVLTTASVLDECFAVDCPAVIGKAHGQMIALYEYGGDFIMNVMDGEQTKRTHWHPNHVEAAAEDMAEFMEGKSDYEMVP